MVSLAFIFGVVIGGFIMWFLNNKFGKKANELLLIDSNDDLAIIDIDTESVDNKKGAELEELVKQFYSEQNSKLKELADLTAEKEIERKDDFSKSVEIIEYDEAKLN